MKAVIHLKYSNELNLLDGNYWSVVVSRTRNEGEDIYHSTDTSIPAVTDQLTELDAERKVTVLLFIYFLVSICDIELE